MCDSVILKKLSRWEIQAVFMLPRGPTTGPGMRGFQLKAEEWVPSIASTKSHSPLNTRAGNSGVCHRARQLRYVPYLPDFVTHSVGHKLPVSDLKVGYIKV